MTNSDIVQLPVKGKVVRMEWVKGYGNAVYVNHDNKIQTRYGHFERYLTTSNANGDSGTSLGIMGNTGVSSGIHLHFEIRLRTSAELGKYSDGSRPIDPMLIYNPQSMSR